VIARRLRDKSAPAEPITIENFVIDTIKKLIPLSFLRFTEAAVETNETRLYKDLFKNYNKYTHPVINESRPVTVTFDFQLIRIIDVVSHIA